MVTKLIGIKDFRQNISEYVKRARKRNDRFIVTNRNKPLFEIKPFAEDEDLLDLAKDILKAEKEIESGKFYTHDEVLKMFS